MLWKVPNIYIVCFDESISTFVKKGQMNLTISKVCTHYLGSVYMRQSTADIFETFPEGVKDLGKSKLFQVSYERVRVSTLYLESYIWHQQQNIFLKHFLGLWKSYVNGSCCKSSEGSHFSLLFLKILAELSVKEELKTITKTRTYWLYLIHDSMKVAAKEVHGNYRSF